MEGLFLYLEPAASSSFHMSTGHLTPQGKVASHIGSCGPTVRLHNLSEVQDSCLSLGTISPLHSCARTQPNFRPRSYFEGGVTVPETLACLLAWPVVCGVSHF